MAQLYGVETRVVNQAVKNNPDKDGFHEIVADIPYNELFEYDTRLYSMTRGSGIFSYEFARYEQAPDDVAQKEIEKNKD